MSLKLTLIGATALAAAACASPAAHAQTALFGGGGTLAAKVYRNIFNCYAANANGLFATSPGNSSVAFYPTAAGYPTAQAAACSTVNSNAVEVGYVPVGSGAGLNAFTSGSPASWGVPASSNPVAYIDTDFTGEYSATTNPYPEVDFVGSDAFLSSAQISAAATVDNGAAVFQIPMLATPITLPIGQANKLVLTAANVCDIFSGQAVVPKNTKAQIVYVRADGSGTSFIFSDWLASSCTGTGAQGQAYAFTAANGFPSTTPNWTAAHVGNLTTVTAVSGSGGIAAAVAATKYAIGYDSPDYVYPVVSIKAYPASVGSLGKAVPPTTGEVTLRLKNVTYPSPYTNNIGAVLNTALAQPSSAGYPIVGFTFIDTYGCYTGRTGPRTAAQGAALKTMLTLALTGSGSFHTEANAILAANGFVGLTGPLERVLLGTNGPFNAKSGIDNRCS